MELPQNQGSVIDTDKPLLIPIYSRCSFSWPDFTVHCLHPQLTKCLLGDYEAGWMLSYYKLNLLTSL